MARRFAGTDFISAYSAYADNGFLPPQFNTWAALSIVAGALERRVWLPWDDNFSFYPNIYVLLVSLPGDGKSAALNRAVSLLQEVNRKTSALNIMPTQVTEAKFIELMGLGRSFSERTATSEITHRQNAGYFFASEASNALKNVYGDFIACLTDFYDCPPVWSRATKKDGKPINLANVCMNILAGSTFDYLGKLVNDENIQGGFASRLIYIVSKNKEINDQLFQLGGPNDIDSKERADYKAALVEDLTSISKMVGPMRADAEFGKAWEVWWPAFERKRRELESEKLQSLMARVNTNVLKVSMLLSAAESDERLLTIKHWNRALELVLPVYDQVPDIFRQARANASERSPGMLKDTVIDFVKNVAGITTVGLRARLVARGIGGMQADQTVAALMQLGVLGLTDGGTLKIVGNPNNHF